jgi:F420-non-reducing hydrogenase large subunit
VDKVTIDPITRLEGHGKIEIFLNDDGSVANAYLQVPELRGFERFCEGRPVEELPRITPRICGVCPDAHHMASAKACDAVYHVDIPPAAKKLRELWYNAFTAGDHCTHFYILAGPDFVMGPTADPAERNILGVIGKVGLDIAKQVIRQRKEAHEVIEMLGGKPTHPVGAIPGGLSKAITEEERQRLLQIGQGMVEFGQFSLGLFADVVLKNEQYMDLVLSDAFTHRTYYIGLVDDNNLVNFYDGHVRVVDPDGKEFVSFMPPEYTDVIAEHVEPWSYLKFPFLKKVGWKGLVDGPDSGVYRAAPLARLNAAEGMATPLAQEAYEKMYSTFGTKPVHQTMAFHWARLIEMLYSGERVVELAQDPDITSPEVHKAPTATPDEGVGIVEAPRGLLIHHYKTDPNGIVQRANLIVGTTNNKAGICMSVKKAAEGVIKPGQEISEGILNIVEMAFRAYDPCFGCATHALPGHMPLIVTIRNPRGEVIQEIRRDG